MKMVVSYLNFLFFIEVKAKSKYRILNFVFQFIKKTKWHLGYTDFPVSGKPLYLFACERKDLVFNTNSELSFLTLIVNYRKIIKKNK